MALDPNVHLQADALRKQMAILNQTKSELNDVLLELKNHQYHQIRLVYLYNDVAKTINISSSPLVSNKIIQDVIKEIDAEILILDSNYQKLCN